MLDTIKGEIKIFTREIEKADGSKRVIFNACVGATKTEYGYINYYMPVNFATALRKDVAKVYTKESFDVLIKEAWIKAYRDKDGNTKQGQLVKDIARVTNDSEENVQKFINDFIRAKQEFGESTTTETTSAEDFAF